MEQVELLRRALDGTGIRIDLQTVERFSVYQEFLLDWNQRINLISRRDEARIVTRHFLHSLGLLRVIPFQDGCRIMDLGAGAGFPGLPIKLVRPDLDVVLVESKRKKCLFLRRVIEGLGQDGIDVVQGRVEELTSELGGFDVVVSRSVADLATLIRWSAAYLEERKGALFTIKGECVSEELLQMDELLKGLKVQSSRVIPYNPFPAIFRLRGSVVVEVVW